MDWPSWLAGTWTTVQASRRLPACRRALDDEQVEVDPRYSGKTCSSSSYFSCQLLLGLLLSAPPPTSPGLEEHSTQLLLLRPTAWSKPNSGDELHRLRLAVSTTSSVTSTNSAPRRRSWNSTARNVVLLLLSTLTDEHSLLIGWETWNNSLEVQGSFAASTGLPGLAGDPAVASRRWQTLVPQWPWLTSYRLHGKCTLSALSTPGHLLPSVLWLAIPQDSWLLPSVQRRSCPQDSWLLPSVQRRSCPQDSWLRRCLTAVRRAPPTSPV